MKKNKELNLLKKLTVILLTNNSREDFIFRSLNNYEREYGLINLKIIISDSGDNKKFKILQNKIKLKKYKIKIRCINNLPKNNSNKLTRDGWGKTKYEYRERLNRSLKLISTKYVVIAADDDFYLPNYFIKAIRFLDNNKNFGSVYGHILIFVLKKFSAYGKIRKFNVSKDDNPPNPWQEDDYFLDRLKNLGKNPWSWFNWYAVQRTRVLKYTVKDAIKYKIDGYLFEKFLTFCHSVLYKAKKLNMIYAARQENPIYINYGREPFSYIRNIKSINNFKEACANFIKKNQHLSYNSTKEIIEKISLKDIRSYQKNDSKEFFRYLKKKSKFINKFNKKVLKPKSKSNIDKRLAKFVSSSFISEIKYLKKIIEN